MRTVRVPWSDRWLARFNKRFGIDKSSYDGRFKSRLGPGYCTGNPPTMFYTFSELTPKIVVDH
jgi:hypothetical protein